MSHTSMCIEHRKQFILLAVIQLMCVPSIIRYLVENCTTSYVDHEKILPHWKDAFSVDSLKLRKQSLRHHNCPKFKNHITVEQIRKARDYGDNTYVSKNLTKTEKTPDKEEHNKNVTEFLL